MLQFLRQKFDSVITQPAAALYDKYIKMHLNPLLDALMEAIPKSRDYRVTFVPLWRVGEINEGIGCFVPLLWILAKNGQLRSQLENDPAVQGKHPFALAIVPTYRSDVIHKIVKAELKYRRDNKLPEPTYVSEIRGPEDYLKKLTTGLGAPLALATTVFSFDKDFSEKRAPDNETMTLKNLPSKTPLRERLFQEVVQWMGLQAWIASPFARRGKFSLTNMIGAVFKTAAIGAISCTTAVGAFAGIAGLGLWGLMPAAVAASVSTAMAGFSAAMAGSATFGFLFGAVRHRFGISPYDNNIDRSKKMKNVIAHLPEVEGKGPKRTFHAPAYDYVHERTLAPVRQRQQGRYLGTSRYARTLLQQAHQQQPPQVVDSTPDRPRRGNTVNDENNNNIDALRYR